MASLLLLLSLLVEGQRTYHRVPLERVAETTWTHVRTCGAVVYRRRMADDGDWHVTIEQRGVKLVLEIIPALPLPVPRKGQIIEAWGITRYDTRHGWHELHPLEGWQAVPRCPPAR